MSRRGRIMRIAATVGCFAALLIGTTAGSDDHFPFGPFRMFANATKPTGAVSVPVLTGTLADGRQVALTSSLLGLRRAELEGRLSGFVEQPASLEVFAVAWAREKPDEPELVAVRLQRRRQVIVDRRPVGNPTVHELAEWSARG